MTSFVAWVGVDERGPASIYFASDSRISWGKSQTWDYGRKLFASSKEPNILGYVGDVLFPSLVLGQISAALDTGMIFEKPSTPGEKFHRIRHSIETSFYALPDEKRQSFTITYATRSSEFMLAEFHFWRLTWSKEHGWNEEMIAMPTRSSALWVGGSGGTEIQKWQGRWEATSQGRTSRAVFSAFCDSLESKADQRSGGAPQLVGLYRRGPAKPIGVAIGSRPFLFGLPLDKDIASKFPDADWRNTMFERCDANGELLEGAKKHHAPRGLGSEKV